jgi:hypothetical protein
MYRKNLLINDVSPEISFLFGSWVKYSAACLIAADKSLFCCGLQALSLLAVSLAPYEMK